MGSKGGQLFHYSIYYILLQKMASKDDSWEVCSQKEQQKPKTQDSKRRRGNAQDVPHNKSQEQGSQNKNQAGEKNEDGQLEIKPDDSWLDEKPQEKKQNKSDKQGNKRGNRRDRNQDQEVPTRGNGANRGNHNQENNQEAPTRGNRNRNQEGNQQGRANRGKYGDRNNYGDRGGFRGRGRGGGFNRGYDYERGQNRNQHEGRRNRGEQGQNPRVNRGNRDYNNNNRDYNRGRQNNNGQKNYNRDRNGQQQRRENGQRPQRNGRQYNINRQASYVHQTNNRPKVQEQPKKIQTLDIVPQGKYCWPESGIYTNGVKVVISYRKLAQFQADTIMIPFNKIKLDIYPGVIINKCKVDYRKKIQQKEGTKQVGSAYIQKCVGISNFKAFAFIRVGKQQEDTIRVQNIRQGMISLFKSIGGLKINVETLLIPYSKQLGDGYEYLRTIFQGIASNNSNQKLKLKVVYIAPHTNEDYCNIADGMATKIKKIISDNELTIV